MTKMSEGTFYGAYNARWLDPEEVASTFVPLSPFLLLIREGHSVLMGPRGCGKTTLLKMLTRRALKTWFASDRTKIYPESFNYPSYESIYIPSDIRWAYEIRGIKRIPIFNQELKEQIQRVLVSISVLQQTLEVFKDIVSDLEIDTAMAENIEEKICINIIETWRLLDTIPSFMDLNRKFEFLMLEIRGLMNMKNPQRIKHYLDDLPTTYFSHSLDIPIYCCKQISNLLPEESRPQKWAICIDELEISPKWLRQEVLTGLRSVDQSFFLKLTWSPILPTAESMPEPGDDFTAIRLWSSHLRDPVEFCENLTRDFLKRRFPKVQLAPMSFLGKSVFASEDRTIRETKTYERGSRLYKSIKTLAAKDESLRRYLKKFNISILDPIPSDDPHLREKQLDQFFRKVKPIILLRNEYLKEGGTLRSRKTLSLYSGREAVYAISEGNPRWLLGLLNDLCDVVDISKISDKYKIPFSKQATVISSASRRFMALIKTTPIIIDEGGNKEYFSLYDLIEYLAALYKADNYGPKFPIDPIGSIKFGGKLTQQKEAIILRALEKGALVHVGKTNFDVPVKISDERFRLSFLICPWYKLPLRNYRSITLRPERLSRKSIVLLKESKKLIQQLLLDFEEDENK